MDAAETTETKPSEDDRVTSTTTKSATAAATTSCSDGSCRTTKTSTIATASQSTDFQTASATKNIDLPSTNVHDVNDTDVIAGKTTQQMYLSPGEVHGGHKFVITASF